MININLLPPEYQKVKKTGVVQGLLNIPMEVVIGSFGGVFLLLIIIHIIFLGINMTRLAKHKNLKKQWEELLPQKEKVDSVIQEMRNLQNNVKAIEEITTENNLSWAFQLNVISDSIPKGVWLKKLSLSGGVLYMDGSAISKQQKEMIAVHSFTSNLKKHDYFMDQFKDLEQGAIQRRKINTTEIADFLITAELE